MSKLRITIEFDGGRTAIIDYPATITHGTLYPKDVSLLIAILDLIKDRRHDFGISIKGPNDQEEDATP